MCVLLCANGHKRVTTEVRWFVSHVCYITILFCMYENVRKSKQSRNRPDVAHSVPGGLGSQISMTFDT
jgi:hypothetical protein